MEQIPETYVQANHRMRLMKREGNVAMYSDTRRGRIYYEIHLVRVAKEREVFGKEYPERERLASSSEFGRYAYACSSLSRAELRFEQMKEEEEDRKAILKQAGL